MAIDITIHNSDKPGCIGIAFMKTNGDARALADSIQQQSISTEFDVRHNMFQAHIPSENLLEVLLEVLRDAYVNTNPPIDEIIASIEERNSARNVYR